MLNKDHIQKQFDSLLLSEENIDFYLLDELLFLGAKINLPRIKFNINKNFIEDKIKNEKIIENNQLFNYLINNQLLDDTEKANLDCYLLMSLINDFIFLSYNKTHQITSKYVPLEKRSNPNYDIFIEIKNIIYRGNVFKKQNTNFVTLNVLLSYLEIFDNLPAQIKIKCYKEFKEMSPIAKKALTSILIKSKNEEALFNLLNYDLSLTQEVVVNDKKNLMLFEMLSFNNWVEFILRNKNIDIRITNKDGENILWNFPSNLLLEENIENLLRIRINELNACEKSYFFHQFNKDGLNPLMNAIIFQDETMIDFIESFNIKAWETVDIAPNYKSALDFLNNYILNVEETGSLGLLIDSFKVSFWSLLAKKWNTQYCYISLTKEMEKNNINQLVEKKKIKI